MYLNTLSRASFRSANDSCSVHSCFSDQKNRSIAVTTIFSNSASDGGGIYNDRYSRLNVAGSIVANNVAADAPDIGGKLSGVSDHNLIGIWNGGAIPGESSLVGTAASPLVPRLGPLGDYGGPTWTMPLLAGSPAIDVGDPGIVDPSATDQRGYVRIADGNDDGEARIDIGAFEYMPGETLVLARHVFYYNSFYDGDDAIAPDQMATFANYTSYDKGINGILLTLA